LFWNCLWDFSVWLLRNTSPDWNNGAFAPRRIVPISTNNSVAYCCPGRPGIPQYNTSTNRSHLIGALLFFAQKKRGKSSETPSTPDRRLSITDRNHAPPSCPFHARM
jgi:hypothetical protein